MNALLDHRETSDSYHGELFRDGKYRVAVCRDGIQWLIQQQRVGNQPVGEAWDTFGFCTTRKALTRLWTGKTGRIHPELENLPAFIKRGTA